jgi:hypothetical protein
MRKLAAVAALSVMCSTSGFAAELTGYISDDACAIKSARSATAADWINPDAFEACAKKCLKEGSTAVFVTEDNKVLTLDAVSSARALPHLGHRVKVTGSATNTTLSVDTIAPIAMKAKAGAKPSGDDHSHR